MNFLAHLYLSGNNPLLMVGNFIADHTKGSLAADMHPEVRRGIMLHRLIDDFTDHHPVVMETKKRLRPQFHKYSPVIADIFYDHFLAADWQVYSPVPLSLFADDVYRIMHENIKHLPPRTVRMLPFMISANWLTAYATINGLHGILTSMAKRTSFVSHMESAAAELEKNYEKYKSEFKIFFPELIAIVSERM